MVPSMTVLRTVIPAHLIRSFSHLDFWTLDVSSLDTFKCRIGGGVALVTRKTNEGPPHAKL